MTVLSAAVRLNRGGRVQPPCRRLWCLHFRWKDDRARRDADGRSVLLKTPHTARPSARDVADFAHEHAVLTKLAGTAVVGAVSLEELERRPWLILDDHGGQSLDRVAARYRLPARTLAVGAKIATALAEIHRSGIVHRDLKPQHVLDAVKASVRPSFE